MSQNPQQNPTPCPPGDAPERTGYELTEPFHRLTDVIKCKWTLAIIRELTVQTSRPSEIQRALPGLSHKVLSDRLKKLEDFGLVDRVSYPEIPPRVEYTLTDQGHDLLGVLEPLMGFIERWDA